MGQLKRHDFGLEHALCRRSVPIMATHRDADWTLDLVTAGLRRFYRGTFRGNGA
jgi:hypothetical protein